MSSNSWDRLSDRRVVRVPFSCRDRSFLKKKKETCVNIYIYIYIYIFNKDLSLHEKRPVSTWKETDFDMKETSTWKEPRFEMKRDLLPDETGVLCVSTHWSHFMYPLQVSTSRETYLYMKRDRFLHEMRPIYKWKETCFRIRQMCDACLS